MSPLAADSSGVIVVCPSCGQGNRQAFGHLGDRTRCGRCKAELAPPSGVVEILSTEVFSSLVRKSSVPVFVDFWAPWCGPCRRVAPEVEQLARLSAGEAVVTKVNTEALPELASQSQIQSIPTFVVFHRGVEAARTSGVMPASRLRDFIRQSIR